MFLPKHATLENLNDRDTCGPKFFRQRACSNVLNDAREYFTVVKTT